MNTKKKPSQDCLAVYDGTSFAGFLDEDRDGQFRAYDLAGQLVGTFKTQRDAMRSIPRAGHG
jgi:hypothetical protein